MSVEQLAKEAASVVRGYKKTPVVVTTLNSGTDTTDKAIQECVKRVK